MRKTGRESRRGKELEWEMRRTKGDQWLFEKKSFLKNQKHESNIVEITHLCIMHRVHTTVASRLSTHPFKYALFSRKNRVQI